MSEIENILLLHARNYPLMRPSDGVKLIYQNEFGGGHLVKDRSGSLEFLIKEYESIVQRADMELYEDIGNGMVRVNLAALDKYQIIPEKLNDWFVLSSLSRRGNMESFKEKLKTLACHTREGVFSFGYDELLSYLDEYEKKACPPVSHSIEYKSAYKPAYRVVSLEIMSRDNLK